jgi:hypothetical protein
MLLWSMIDFAKALVVSYLLVLDYAVRLLRLSCRRFKNGVPGYPYRASEVGNGEK